MQEEKRLRYYIDQGYQDGYTLETIEGSGGFGSVFKLKDNSVEGVYKAVKMITVPKNMEEARFYYKKSQRDFAEKGNEGTRPQGQFLRPVSKSVAQSVLPRTRRIGGAPHERVFDCGAIKCQCGTEQLAYLSKQYCSHI